MSKHIDYNRDQLYTERKAVFKNKVVSQKKRVSLVATMRLVSFVGGIIGTYLFYRSGYGMEGTLFLMTTIVVFGVLVKWYNKVEFQLRLFQSLEEVNENEIKRANLKLNDFDTGQEFMDMNHSYASDLDLFGSHSLFQFLNRVDLKGGQKKLSQWMKGLSHKKELLSRKQMTIALASQLDWVQSYLALSNLKAKNQKKSKPKVSEKDVLQWANQPIELPFSSVLNAIRYILPITVLSIFIMSEGGVIPQKPYLSLAILCNLLLLGFIFKKMLELTKSANGILSFISTYERLIEHIQSASFENEDLKGLQQKIMLTDLDALQGISSLRKLVNRLDARSNVFFIILNVVLLLDYHTLFSMISWKMKFAKPLKEWIKTVDDFAALCSIAAFRHNNRSFCEPVITDGAAMLESKTMAHPLLPDHKRVPNDFCISDIGTVHLITGSNMSGKSTFQRTLGVNLVLAQTGASVCADEFRFSLFNIFTSMRTHDDLSESISSFYAELKRLKKLLDNVNDGYPTFFLLDEILKGTNSDDRHKGAEALIYQLNKMNALGLISTHDLTLSKLSEETNFVKNYSFNSNISGDEIVFEYKLTKGPCRSFNASFLMQKMGIEITDQP